MIWTILGVAFYSLVIGTISSFLRNKDTKQSLLAKRIRVVDEFCRNLNIKEELKDKLCESISYSSNKLAYLWLKPNEDIFSDLSMQLKFEFLQAIHQQLIESCEFFKGKDISFIVRIIPLLKPIFYKAGSTIWSVKDFSSCGMFF